MKPDKWQRAPRIPAVAAMVAAAIQDQLLVGHGLKKDLHSLSLTHPPHLTRDTMTYEVFQSRGHARKLKALTLDLLGKSIQMGRHRARWGFLQSFMHASISALACTAGMAHRLYEQNVCCSWPQGGRYSSTAAIPCAHRESRARCRGTDAVPPQPAGDRP